MHAQTAIGKLKLNKKDAANGIYGAEVMFGQSKTDF